MRTQLCGWIGLLAIACGSTTSETPRPKRPYPPYAGGIAPLAARTAAGTASPTAAPRPAVSAGAVRSFPLSTASPNPSSTAPPAAPDLSLPTR